MKRVRILGLVLAMLLSLGGCLSLAEEEILFTEQAEASVAEIGLLPDAPEVLAAEAEAEAEEAPQEAEEAVQEAGEETTGEEAARLSKLILPKKIVIGKKEEVQLRPEVEPAGAACALSYSPGKGGYAKVTKGGLVTGRKKGTQTITVTATAENGESVSAKVKVEVKAAPKKVAIAAEKKRLRIGDTEQLSCTLPEGTAGACAFSAKKNEVLSVTPEGLVTALSPGTAEVTVRTYNGHEDALELTVLPDFEITFMNIGRNDGILIQCDGEYAFIDSGMRAQGLKAARYMKNREVTHLKYYIGSHAHRDHVGGAPAILAAIKTDEVIVSHTGTRDAIKRFAETSAEKKAVKKAKYRVVKRGKTFRLGSAEFLVLGPVKLVRTSPGATAENGNSLILRLTYGENTFLLTGDATGTELSAVNKASPGCLKAQVLKNPHHNGRLDFIIKKCRPEITVFSTSNARQPTSSFISFIKKMGSKVYITSTNRNGHVIIASDGKTLKVTPQKK